MPKIHVLEPAIANKIAAGEVVERPSSVVKELVENALDAGASRIEVEIEEGGKNLIRVADNGVGIEPEELPLAFAAHATSKLTCPEDLFAISTMGFRGEALASIGSVAQMKLISLYRGQELGAEVECRGSELSKVKVCSATQGTILEVRNLFYNVPVRRKFLKSTASETANITDILTRMALAYPGVHFRLTSNQKEVFNCPPSTRLDRISSFYGRDLADGLIKIESRTEELQIEGFAALPAVNRANRTWQLLFLNGRSIQDKSISHAMNEAYRGLMPGRRFPVLFIFLEMDPAEVDVNAHPTKIEVRFRNNWGLYGRVLNAIRQGILSEEKVAPLTLDPQISLFDSPSSKSSGTSSTRAPSESDQSQPVSSSPSIRNLKPIIQSSTETNAFSEEKHNHDSSATTIDSPSEHQENSDSFTVSPSAAIQRGKTSKDDFQDETTKTLSDVFEVDLRGLLQIHNSYIVQETKEGFLLIDQHALHERILYCEIRDKVQKHPIESQQLLLPEPVDITPKEMALIRELKPTLQKLGLVVEEFGQQAVVVQAIPAFIRETSVSQLLHDILSELAEGKSPRSLEKKQDRILATMACRGAIKFGDQLSKDEIASLLKRSKQVPESIACPHGRPTKLSVNLKDLERQFGRK